MCINPTINSQDFQELQPSTCYSEDFCFISDNVVIKNSIIGPYVSIGEETTVENSSISKTIIQNESSIINAKINNSMIGNKCYFDVKNTNQQVSIGDFSEVK